MKLTKFLLIAMSACLTLFSAAAIAQPETPCNPCITYCSYTQGGWGAPCNGGNVGCLRNECFDAIYPNGVTIGRDYPGGCCWIHLTSSQAVQDFLPQGTTATALTQNYTDPGVGNITVFAGQVLALQLNVDYGAYGCGSMVDISGLTIGSGTFAGWTVTQLLDAANLALGGGALPPGVTIQNLNDACDSVNNNFDNCTDNDGYLVIPPQGETVVIREQGETGPATACLSFTDQCSDICLVWWCNFCGPHDFANFTVSPGCEGPDCSEDCTPNPGSLQWGDQILVEPDPNGGCWWYAQIHATDPGCFCVTLEFQLAVDLLDFHATPGNGEVALNWVTASERDNDYFDIQRSLGSASWSTVGRVDGHGTVTGMTNYHFVDNSVINGTQYNYRLLSVDLSGNVSQVGDVVLSTPSVNAGVPNEYALYQNYPNPFNPTTSIRFDVAEAGHVTLKVFDLTGRVMATLVDREMDANSYTVSFDAASLPSGAYFYRLESGAFTATHKMLLLK